MMYVCPCHYSCVETRGKLSGIFSFFPPLHRPGIKFRLLGFCRKGLCLWIILVGPILLTFFFFFYWGKVSRRSGWPISCFAAKVVLELLILLPPPSSYSGCICAPLHPASICTVLKATLASCYGFSLCVFSLATLSWNSVNLHVLLLIRDQHQDFKCPWKHT